MEVKSVMFEEIEMWLTDNMRLWLKNLFLEEAEQQMITAENENLWALGSTGEAAMLHANNGVEHVHYANLLKMMAVELENKKYDKNTNSWTV
jgi:hypothetical protein